MYQLNGIYKKWLLHYYDYDSDFDYKVQKVSGTLFLSDTMKDKHRIT